VWCHTDWCVMSHWLIILRVCLLILTVLISEPNVQITDHKNYRSVWRHQGSLHLHVVRTGRLDFSLGWLKSKVWENLGDFRKAGKILTFFFRATVCPPTFHKTNVPHNDLKKYAVNKYGIKYWTSPVWVKFQKHGSSFYVNIEEIIGDKLQTYKDWHGD